MVDMSLRSVQHKSNWIAVCIDFCLNVFRIFVTLFVRQSYISFVQVVFHSFPLEAHKLFIVVQNLAIFVDRSVNLLSLVKKYSALIQLRHFMCTFMISASVCISIYNEN